VFDKLIGLKDFRLESSLSPSPSNTISINIGHGLKANNMLSISLINCQIKLIDSNVINRWSNLRMISLAHNQISELNRNWFPSELKNLWSLDLSYNSISVAPQNFFNGMPALKKLRLDNNSFYTLHYNWFESIWTNLHELWIDSK